MVMIYNDIYIYIALYHELEHVDASSSSMRNSQSLKKKNKLHHPVSPFLVHTTLDILVVDYLLVPNTDNDP